VRALQSLAYRVVAVGDSHNDLEMLYHADFGLLLNPPPDLAAAHGQLCCIESLGQLRERLEMLGATP
jgi:phosphoserine phosphatase